MGLLRWLVLTFVAAPALVIGGVGIIAGIVTDDFVTAAASAGILVITIGLLDYLIDRQEHP